MGKKKSAVFRNGADNALDTTKGDKIDAIRTWDDVEHDSEDDCKFFFSRTDRSRILIQKKNSS